MLKLSTCLWLKFQNQKGGVLIENKALMIMGIVMIFGASGLIFTFLQDYFNQFSNDVSNSGTNNSFRSVTWR